ncbi:sugar ABC transporter ATP-binding protein [Schnuerera ultunensis]|uniref:sugar ABC transporter ATP-binding protein n=1 Tax=Schnuerera ultunensis TaxID=45497 RepID=UPI0004185A15|nr:sugar ABC transporter ATP-binding protein [Schnuerera ultunensis]
MEPYLVSMENISKFFPGVKALDQVSFQLKAGEVHALLGENGAGKSTLMKVLTGVYHKDNGVIKINGKEVDIADPKAAQELGISIIHQEFNLLPHLTVAQNIFIGREPRKVKGILDEKKLNEDAKKILKRLDLDLEPTDIVKDLSVAEQQMVEIAKAISVDSRVLIMDEPTAALTEGEVEKLFEIIKTFRNEGIGIVYISHKMEEFQHIVDRATVMRDGQYIGTVNFKETTLDHLIQMMVGRDLKDKYPEKHAKIGENFLEVKNISRENVLDNISFNLRKGEILGIAGLMGSGRTELARAIFGADPIDKGEIYLHGKKINISNPGDAISEGIGYLSEDRKRDGLALGLDVEDNIVLASLKDFANKFGIVQRDKTLKESEKQVKDLKVKTPSLAQKVGNLSGGNQQKVIIGKWLCKNMEVFIFDEPTRGIDVGAKYEVYNLMNQLADDGAGIIMISSELPEILGMSDRVLVMCEGRIAAELDIEEADQETIMFYATGGK